jgi:hypothetical protein
MRRLRPRAAEVLAPLAVVAILVLSTSFIDVSPITRGIAAAIATVLVLVAIETAQGGPVNRVLSNDAVTYLGRISYGTYLWHWPVILVATRVVPGITPWSAFLVAALVATGLASLSYQIIERPIRQQPLLDRVNSVVVVTGLAVAIVAALVVVPRILDPFKSRGEVAQASTNVGFTPIPNFDFAHARTVSGLRNVKLIQNCVGKSSSACTIVSSSGERILVTGDSHAEMFDPTFAKIAQTRHLTLSTAAHTGCPWQRDLYAPVLVIAQRQVDKRSCIAFKRDLYDRVIPALKPDLIVAVSNDYLTRSPGTIEDQPGKPLEAKTPDDLRRLVAADTEKSLKLLEASAGRVLIVQPVPTTTTADDPFVCLTKKKFLEDCRFTVDPQPTPLQRLYRSLADGKRVYTANFAKLLCPYFPICDPVINGLIVRFDNQHITARFAVAIAPEVTAFLQDSGLIPR